MKRALIIGLGGALLIAVVALLVYGLATHQEPGLVQICADGAATVRYAPPAECDAADLVWPRSQLPLDVWPVPSVVRDVALPTQRALDHVNAQLGFGALRLATTEAGADVTVTFDVAHEARWAEADGSVAHVRAGSKLTAQVLVGNVPDVVTLHAVLVHELGHVLGLEHDDFEASAMFRSIGPVRSARFTDSDRALLRRIYESES